MSYNHSPLILILATILPSIGHAADPEWKLQPLQYHNPGLVVDLGVGLWAYPLPVDYDGDGDLDLLVSCPDKPSNGLYYFENPSQNPHEKMPTFKPGIRIGPAHPYMLMSQVGDESVIMIPGKEFRRDPTTRQYNFNKPKTIDAITNPNSMSQGRTRANMWRYVDYDGDGDHDIIVGSGDWSEYGWDHAYDNHGQWHNGPLHGFIYLILNNGTDTTPIYSKSPQRLQGGGGTIDVYGWPSPNMADFDGDGDLDLLCGEFLDGFTYFQNVGTRTKPVYGAGQKLKDAYGEPLTMHLQMITPTAIDWDADGDIDLIVGDEDGRVAFVENWGEARDGQPVFKQPVYFQQEADTLKFGALATPFAYDWDHDGDEDILCGNTAGEVGFFENLGPGANSTPKWNAPKLLNVKQLDGTTKPFRIMAGVDGSIQGPCEAKWGYTTFSVADLDYDGDGDITYNSILGRLGILYNQGGTLVDGPFEIGRNEYPPVWDWQQSPSGSTLTQWRTTPCVADFDGDGTLDLVMLDQEGYLTLRRGGKKAERIFVDEQNRPLQLNPKSAGGSGRVKLAIVDWDSDSRLDVLVNSENVLWYRNCETRNGKVVLKPIGNLTQRNVSGHTASPAVCDFNKDGKPDLLVGSENGRIYHILHDDCVQFTAEQLKVKPVQKPTAAKFPGLVSEEFIFDKAPFKACHASTICQTTRGLIAAWFGGTKEGKTDVGIWSSYHDGQSWSKPTLVADGVQHDGLRYPCWNPVLFQPPGAAPTLLFFKVGPSPSKWWGEMMVSHDRGRTFVDRRRLPEGIVGPVRSKPMLLNDGQTLLCGSSTEDEGWRVHFETVQLVDGLPTNSWHRVGPIDGGKFSAIQPTFLNLGDGKIEALCRTREGVIATTVSADAGKTWSMLQATELPNPNSGIEAMTLRDGRHLLVYNPLGTDIAGWGRRGILSLALSTDGTKWTPIGELDRAMLGEFSYPAMIQSSDGLVHIIYTWNRRKIKHLVVDPKQFK